MKEIVCSRCGASDWSYKNGFRVCNYCNTKFQLTNDDITITESSIELNDDVRRLLQKCKDDPKNARKYANLILDIDPSNKDAHKYL